MGFDWTQIINLLRFEASRINGDIEWAVNYIVKGEQGYTHNFVPDEEKLFDDLE